MDRKVVEVSSISLSFSLFLWLSTYLPTDQSMYLFIYLSIDLSIYLYLSIYIFLSIYIPIYLSIYLSLFLSIFLSIYRSFYLSINLSIYPSIHLSIFLSIYLSIYPSIYLPIFLSVYLSIYLSIFLSIYLSTYLSIYLYLFIYLSINLSIYLYLSIYIYLSIHLSIYPSISNYIYLSTYLPIYLFYLSIYLSIYLFFFLSFYLSSIYLSFFLSIYRSIYLSIYLSLSLSVCLSICLSASLKTKLFCETSSVFELDNLKKNAAIQRDLLNVCTWQRQKRSNSARLPQFLNLTTSKTKQFCEASFKNGKLSAELTASYQCVLRFFHSTCLNYWLRLPRKSDARSYEVLHLSRKIISANLKIWCSKMQPLSGNQCPHLLTAPMKMSLVLRLPRKMHLCRSSSNVPCLPSFLEMLQNPHVSLTFDKVHHPLRLPREATSERPKVVRTPGVFWLGNVLRATTACTFSTSERPKVVRTPGVFNMLTWKCASRHNGVHFFDISTSKSGPELVCFVHFDLEMCFATQRRAIFHLSSGQLAPHPPL